MKLRIYADVKVKINAEDIHKSNVIYCLTFENGKKYVGLTTRDLDSRINEHCRYSFNNKTKDFNSKKGRAIRKYMTFEVSVLYEGDDLNEKEIEFIELYDSFNNGYNLTVGGEGATGYVCSNEMRQHISKKLIGNKNSEGHIHTQETKDKIAKRFIKPVLQYNIKGDFIAEYKSVKEAKELNKGCSKLDAVCRGERDTAGGYKWKYKE